MIDPHLNTCVLVVFFCSLGDTVDMACALYVVAVVFPRELRNVWIPMELWFPTMLAPHLSSH
jgi:hypothetical protein